MSEHVRRHHHRVRGRRRHPGAPAGAVRQADAAAGARRLAAARARELGRQGGVRRQPVRLDGHLVRPRRARPSSRRSTTSSAARRSSTARRCTGCGSRTSASCKHHGGISPAWPIGYDVFEPYYTQAEELYQVHGARGEDPTEPPVQRRRTRSRRCRTSRASSSCSTTWPRSGCTRSTPRPGSCSTRPTLPFSPCIRCATCDGFPCLVHAKSDADVIAVRPALQARQRHAGAQRHGAPAGDRRDRPHGDLGRGRRRRRRAAVHRRRSSWSRPARRTRRKLLLASANDKHPNGLANGSDQVGRNYVFHNSRAFLAISTEKNDTRFQKTLGRQRLLLRRRRLRRSRWATCRWSASRRRRCTAARSRSRPSSRRRSRSRDVAERAVDFWLSAEDLPDAGQPGHPRRATATSC